MKRQKTPKKRQKATQGVYTVTSQIARQRQNKADSENAVTLARLVELKNLIRRVNLLPYLPHWVEESQKGESATQLLPTLDWEIHGMSEYSVSGEMHLIAERLPQELKGYIRLGDIEEIKFYCDFIEEPSIRQEIDTSSFAAIWESFERLRAERRWRPYYYGNRREGSDPRFTNVILSRRRLIELLAAQELLYAISSDDPKRNLLIYARLYRQVEEYSIESGLGIDENNRIKSSNPELFGILENVDATKIRKCPICLKIFWADHGRMKFCSQKCGTSARVRKLRNKLWQEAYQEKYKQQRYKKAKAKETAAQLASSKKSSVKQKRK